MRKLLSALILLSTLNTLAFAEQLQCPERTIPMYSCINKNKTVTSNSEFKKAVNVFREFVVCNAGEGVAKIVGRDNRKHEEENTFLLNADGKNVTLVNTHEDMLVAIITINKTTLKAKAELYTSENKTTLKCSKIK